MERRWNNLHHIERVVIDGLEVVALKLSRLEILIRGKAWRRSCQDLLVIEELVLISSYSILDQSFLPVPIDAVIVH